MNRVLLVPVSFDRVGSNERKTCVIWIFGRPFAKRFALYYYYQTVVCPVCDVGAWDGSR